MPFDRPPAPPRLTLVLGGARSGKSDYASSLVSDWGGPALFVATAEPLDDEMRERIAQHRARRPKHWTTIEAPLELARVLRAAEPGVPMLVDCLTLWLSNLFMQGADVARESAALVEALAAIAGPAVLVANEVGLGIVPENALARRFRDAAGALNRAIAARAERVVLLAAGLPLVLKG